MRPFAIATDTAYAPFNFREEHMATRKDWCAYIFVKTALNRQQVTETYEKTEVNRQIVKQADELIALIHARQEQALRRQP